MTKGAAIRLEKGYKDSNIGVLEAMSKGIPEFFQGEDGQDENGCQKYFHAENADFDSTFIALATPSFAGKTQSAFTINAAKVLYFVLLQCDPNRQHIYSCFQDISNFMISLAFEDLESIRKKYDQSGTWIKNNPEIPFGLLGFWHKLMELASQTTSNEDWLMKMAKLQSCDFFSMTSSKFKASYPQFGPFCIFLDEFSTESWAVFARDLAREAGFSCIAANTNSQIVNLIGKTTLSTRTEPKMMIENEAESVI